MSAAHLPRGKDLYVFFALAVGITWILGIPVAHAIVRQTPPSPPAMLMAGLSAWGPTFAALAIALRRKEKVFERRALNPLWIVVGLLLMPALHLPATLIEVALGGHPTQWFYPPVKPEHVAALVMFSIGEELGWRGFAYPRAAERHGPVLGSVLIGVVWTFWHFVMWFTPNGPPSPAMLGVGLIELTLGSVVFAWVFEKGNRNILVAIAAHASAHLDNTFRAPETEVRLRVLRVLVLAAAAVLAGRALSRTPNVAPAT